MDIQFWGAAGCVTGSMHLVEAGGRRLLVDCGMYQGRRSEAYDRNHRLPFDARSIDAVILSHAHIDHSGNLPTLVNAGFDGPIYCTAATRDLCAYMLLDSAHIQESDVEFVNKRRRKRGEKPFTPLYTQDDATETLRHFVTFGYHKPFTPFPGVTAHFIDAGHVLGSGSVVIDLAEGMRQVRALFSGDVGRRGQPILRDPEMVDGVDCFVVEGTYGDRVHETRDQARQLLLETLRETCCEKKAKLLIPVFALERTQELVYHLNQFWESGELPPIDVYVDSPLAVNLTDVFRGHPECYDSDMREAIQRDSDGDPLGFDRLHYVRTTDQSKMLNHLEAPAVIMAASGMCEAGRILHHLANHVSSPRTTVLFVGFQAENTLGRRLVDGARSIKLFGEEHDVRAKIVVSHGYSAHADRPELLAWAKAAVERGHVRRAFVVHGEDGGLAAMADGLRAQGVGDVIVPRPGDRHEL